MSATTTLANLRGNQAAPERMNMQQINSLPRDRQAIAMLDAFKNQLAVALPAHLSPDRMARTALTAMRQNPALLNCDPTSVFASVLLSAQLGLEIGVDGQAYLVPYKGKCTFVPGWKGYVDLINRAKAATVWTGAVFKGDRFEYALGDSPFVNHQPMGECDETKGNLTHVYAIGRIHDAHWPVVEVWPVARVLRHLAKFNKVGSSHYANSNDASFIGYARKVPLMQVMKYMPKSVELRGALATDANANVNIKDVIDGDWTNLAAEAEADRDDMPPAIDNDHPQGQPSADDNPPSPSSAEAEPTSIKTEQEPLPARTRRNRAAME